MPAGNALNIYHGVLVYNAHCPEWWPVGPSLWADKKSQDKGTVLLSYMRVPL